MKLWLIGGLVVGLAGVSIYLTATKRSAPAPAVPAAPLVVEASATPVAPAPLALQQVVDVTNIDPWLDPPAIPVSDSGADGPTLIRVGYEEVVPRTVPSVDVKPIPKAAEDESID